MLHDSAEGVCESKRRGFPIGELPQLFQRCHVPGFKAAGKRAMAVDHPSIGLVMAPFAGVVRRNDCQQVGALRNISSDLGRAVADVAVNR